MRIKMITLTKKAIKQIKSLDENKLLRIGVKGGGCSGLMYYMDFNDEYRPDDIKIQIENITVILDPKSALYLKGTEVDFSDGLNGTGFVYNNPKAQRSCGCNMSFSV